LDFGAVEMKKKALLFILFAWACGYVNEGVAGVVLLSHPAAVAASVSLSVCRWTRLVAIIPVLESEGCCYAS
jgi:predicted nicotinamide N-methyase